MRHFAREPIIRTNAVQRCAADIMKHIASSGAALLADMQMILLNNLGSPDPQSIEFEESSLLVRTMVNTEIADGLRGTRSNVILWLCGAALETPQSVQ
ncbi:hypothetical protein FJZ27_03440 [Candidatus Peribacteria bacterium]|nr:hypothetical protein [Candidatus Peribacteria bacterium]